MSAMALSLDGLNINTTTAASGYFAMEPIDWGAKAISDVVNSGQYRLEDMDAVLSAGRVLRQVVIPLRIIGTSSDDLDSKIAAINIKLSKASRYAPVNLTVTPQGSSAVSTFKVVGGSLDDSNNSTSGVTGSGGWWTKSTDVFFRVDGNLILQTLPFVYGAKQTYGSSGAPLLSSSTPALMTVTPTANGDVLSDVTISLQAGTNTCQAAIVGCISGMTGWTEVLDITSFTQVGGGTFATISNAKYLGGAAPAVTLTSTNTILSSVFASSGISHANIPTQTPIRIFAVVDDVTTTAANRGLNQFRIRLSQGTANAIGDWLVCPPGAFSGASHFSQTVDCGTFTFPPGQISDQTSYGGTTIVNIDMQTANASPTQIVMDSLILVPDSTSLVAEFLSTGTGITTSTATRFENDLLFDTFGQTQTSAVTGAHVRSLGTTGYLVYGSQNQLAGLTQNTTYELIHSWAEVTPRYLGLAPV